MQKFQTTGFLAAYVLMHLSLELGSRYMLGSYVDVRFRVCLNIRQILGSREHSSFNLTHVSDSIY